MTMVHVKAELSADELRKTVEQPANRVSVEVELSAADLLKAVEQLSPPELEQHIAQALSLRAQHTATSSPTTESELLRRINTGFSDEFYTRLDNLIAKRQDDTLSSEEHAELMRMLDQVEARDVSRLYDLMALAQIRSTTVPQLVAALGIHPRPHD